MRACRSSDGGGAMSGSRFALPQRVAKDAGRFMGLGKMTELERLMNHASWRSRWLHGKNSALYGVFARDLRGAGLCLGR